MPDAWPHRAAEGTGQLERNPGSLHPGEFAAKKVDDGKGRDNSTSDIWSFVPRQESAGNWYVEMKVQASDSRINHGTLTFTASLDGHSESTTFTV